MEKIVHCPSCYGSMHKSSFEDNKCLQENMTSSLITQIGKIFILSIAFVVAQSFFCVETPLITFTAFEILKFAFGEGCSVLPTTTPRGILIHETINRIAISHNRSAPSILISDDSVARCKINSIILTHSMLSEEKLTDHEVEAIVAHEMGHWLHYDPEISLLAQLVSAIALCGIGYTKSLHLMMLSNVVLGVVLRMHHFCQESEADLKGISLINDGHSKFLRLKGSSRLDRDFVAKKGLLSMVALASVGPKSYGSGVLGGYPTMGQQLTFVLQHKKLPSFWMARLFKMVSTPVTGDFDTLREYKPSFV